MEYTSISVPLDSLLLDPKNPRFILPVNPTQIDIIKYLIKYEKVEELASGIDASRGLLPGEKPIVFEENGFYIVLEGNRRICACKLLVDPSLVPNNEIFIPLIDDQLRGSLSSVEVDLVPSRESVQSTLYNRHIRGIREWKTLAKLRFFADHFISGKTVEEIKTITSSTYAYVESMLKEYQLYLRLLSNPKWTSAEKAILQDVNLKLNRFLRIFESNSPQHGSVTELLKMSYDDKFIPQSDLGKSVFDEVLYIIGKKAFIEKDKKKRLTTRRNIEDIPELIDFLIKNGTILINENYQQANEQAAPASTVQNQSKISTINDIRPTQENIINDSLTQIAGETETSLPVQTTHSLYKHQKGPTSIPPFFGSLTWNGLDPNNQEEQGLINIAKEIRLMSTNLHYTKYPISAAILLRALFEQSLKHLIKKRIKWDDLLSFRNKQGPYDPMLGEIIKYLNHNFNYKVLIDKKPIQSSYEYAVRHENVVFFDTIIHNSFAILPTGNSLEEKANGGLLALISYILNL